MANFIESYYAGGVFARPDASGIRGKGVGKKAMQNGGDDYPYDKSRGKYGQPAAHDRQSAGHGGSHQNVPTPKGIKSDDDRWQDDIDEKNDEGWIDGMPRLGNIVPNPGSQSKFGLDDDEVEEAMGTPVNVAKAGQGNSSQGGRTMPGTSGQWGGRPKGGHWDNEMDDEELSKYGKVEEFTGIPFAPNPKNIGTPHDERGEDQTVYFKVHVPDDVEDDEEDGSFEKFLQTQYKAGLGNHMKHSRYTPGFSFRENKKGIVGQFLREQDVEKRKERQQFNKFRNEMYENEIPK